MGRTPLFEAVGVRKAFHGTIALRGVSIVGYAGEVLGLAGENGAGKSTLMKVLAGVYPSGSFEGEILLEGRPARFASVRDAERAGIVLIPQELAVVPEMSVAENLFLSHLPTRFLLVDFERLLRDASELLGQFELDVDPATPIGRLSIAQQQIVEIAKALAKDARVLILDEPTSSLTDHEAEILFAHLRTLRVRGLCAVYITHRIDELQDVTDRIVVLRDGRMVGQGETPAMSSDQIVALMVGRDLREMFPRRRRERGQPLLEVEDWSVRDARIPDWWRVRNVSFSVHAGEIVGLFGGVGAGRSELLLSLIGAYPRPGHGRVRVAGRATTIRDPSDALSAGVALVAEDRQRFGIEPAMDVGRNLSLSVLPELCTMGVIDRAREAAVAQYQVNELRILTPGLESPIASLSGGNQQKVILGRALLTEPKVLLLDEPTRGIDVGAKADIFRLLEDLVDDGKGVVFVSSEAPEVLGVADRVLVMREGQVVGHHVAAEVSVETLVAEATGG
jgi:D-xylose transport system ATP-binding protein